MMLIVDRVNRKSFKVFILFFFFLDCRYSMLFSESNVTRKKELDGTEKSTKRKNIGSNDC